jgi:hypothetical protein
MLPTISMPRSRSGGVRYAPPERIELERSLSGGAHLLQVRCSPDLRKLPGHPWHAERSGRRTTCLIG